MNVWVFNQFAGSPFNSSGAGERYHFVSKKLKEKHGVDITIFAASYNHLFIRQPMASGAFTVEYIDGVRYCWVKIPKYSAESGLGRLISWMVFMSRLFFIPKKVANSPDTIIVSSMSMFPIYPALLKRFFSKKRVKVIFEIRDIWPRTLIEMGGFSKFNPVILFLSLTEKMAYSKSDQVISVLPFADRHIKEKIKKPFSFTWIPNGIDVTDHEIESNAEINLPKDKIIVAYAGALGKPNALETWIKSFSYLKNQSHYVFLILGTGPELERLKNLSGNHPSIIFSGKVPKENVHSILLQCDILFIGWHNFAIYNFGVSANKYGDYMLAKKPIVSEGDLAYDPVKEAQCGVAVKPGDAEGIANAIERLMQLPLEERAAMGQRGYTYLSEKMSMNVISEKFYQLLNP